MTTPVEQLSFIPTSSTSKRSLGDWTGDVINVLNFPANGVSGAGVDPTGVLDSTLGIQAAFDAAFGPGNNPHDQNTALNKPVYFPAGGYKITAPLRLNTVRSGRIFGDGYFCTSIAWSGNAFNGNTLSIENNITAKIDNGSGSAGTILTVTASTPAPNPIANLMFVRDILQNVAPNTRIIETHAENPARTGTGGTGTYTVSISQNVSSQAMLVTDGGNPNNNITCMLECNGLARIHISGINFSFGNSQASNTTCVYGYGHRTTTQVEWDSCEFGGATYGMIVGAGSPNGVSEWHYYNCTWQNNGQTGILITGQNTLNHNFINCSFGSNGGSPITSTFTAKIDNGSGSSGNILNVSAFTPSASNPPLAVGMLIYDPTNGAVAGMTTITETHAENAARTGIGGTGTYTVSPSQNVSSIAMAAFNSVGGGIQNNNGSVPLIHGCDMTGNTPQDVYDQSSNMVSLIGSRSESLGLLNIGAGTVASVTACSSVGASGTWTCTSTGNILHVNADLHPGSQFIVPGSYCYGGDGTNNLPAANFAAVPVACRIMKQLSATVTATNPNGTLGSTGDYLLSTVSSPGNLTSCTITINNTFLDCQGSGQATLENCVSRFDAALVGNNNSTLRIRNNGFSRFGTSVPADLFKFWGGQILEYDIAFNGNFIVANLPAAAAIFKGVRMFVTDSNIALNPTNIGTDISSHGGSNITVPVYCDGAAWRIG